MIVVILVTGTLAVGGLAAKEYYDNLIENFFKFPDFDWSTMLEPFAELIGYNEDIDRETAQMLLAQKAEHESDYYNLKTDSPEGALEWISHKYQETVNSLDVNRNTLTDLSNSETQYVQNKSLDLGDEDSLDEIFEDHYGSDDMIKILNEEVMLIFSKLHQDNYDLYLENEAQPVFFQRDYIREKFDEELGIWEEFVIIPQWDEDGKLIPIDFSDTRVYEPKQTKIITTKYENTGNNREYISEFEFMDSYYNQFGNEVEKAVDRVYYQVDEFGEPITLDDTEEYLPQKHLQVPRYVDGTGQLLVYSMFKYNYKIEKEAVPMFPIDDMTESEIEQAIEDGEEGVDYIWDYSGTKYISYASVNEDGDLKFNCEPNHFRYYYENGQIVDTAKSNVNEEYIFDADINRLRDKETFEVISPIINSVADSGLGTINDMIQKSELQYVKAVAFKEEIDFERVHLFMEQQGYDMNYFTLDMIENGYYPEAVSEHPEFREFCINYFERPYINEINKHFGGDLTKLLPFIDDNGKILKREKVEDEHLATFDQYFYNEEWNERLFVLAPHLEGATTAFGNTTMKDFIEQPERTYESMVVELNEDSAEVLTVDLDGIGDLFTDIYKSYTDVNNLNLKEFSHNKNQADMVNEITSNGSFTLTSRDMADSFFLVTESLNLFGRFNFSYEEKEMSKHPLPKQELIIGAYEYNRKRDLQKIRVMVEYTHTKSFKKYEEDNEGNKILDEEGNEIYSIETKDTEKETEFEVFNTDLTGLEVYKNDSLKSEYSSEDKFVVNAVDGKDFVEVRTPTIPDAYVANFELESGSSNELGYSKKEIDNIYFILEYKDNRDAGTIDKLYLQAEGSIFSMKPLLRDITFNDEEYRSFKTRLQTNGSGIVAAEKENRLKENDYYIRQLEAYIRNHSYYSPLNLKYSDRINDVSDEFYQVVNNLDFSEANVAFELNDYKSRLSTLIEVSDIKKKLLNNSKSNDLALTLILGLITEEQGMGEGDLNIKFYDKEYVNAKDGITDSDAVDFLITKEEANDEYLASQYVVNRFRNLLYYYDGNVPMAIFAYHTGVEFADHLIGRNPQSFAKRPHDDFVDEYTYFHSDRVTDNLNNYIVETVLSYTKDYDDVYDLARTDLKFFESIWVDIKQDIDDITETTINVFDKMLNIDLTNSGIEYVENNHNDYETAAYMRLIFTGLTGEKFSEVDDFELATLLGGSFASEYNGDWKSTNNFDKLSESQMKELGEFLQNREVSQKPQRDETFDFAITPMGSSYGWGHGRGIVGIEASYLGYPQYVSAPGHNQTGTYVAGSWDCSGFVSYVMEKHGFPIHQYFGTTADSQYRAIHDEYGVSLYGLELMDIAWTPRADGIMSHVGFFVGFAEDGDPLYLHMGGRYSKIHISKVPSFMVYAKNPMFEIDY